MTFQYTAKIYVDNKVIEQESGDDIDTLYTWMLTKAASKFGNYHGEIIDEKTKKVVKSFRKSPPD